MGLSINSPSISLEKWLYDNVPHFVFSVHEKNALTVSGEDSMPGEVRLVADEDDRLGVHVVPLVDESQNVLGHLEAPLRSDRVHHQVGVGGVHVGEVLSLQTTIKKMLLFRCETLVEIL
ncbi:hypothetical protein CEXT_172671 [Caerostris extrusa]|uniref:Uncharacterized protein n=1 Tax=Caerostris extrusa TaxID=172846 RepID=A0AAV4XG38_CAEEX|nr:hypothetical protein CEXT_172671 [Caerostris extrusa]